MKAVFCLLLILYPITAYSQQIPDNTVLATVGDEQITVGEFKARYALSVFPYKDQERLTPVVKVQFLYSLIAERLLMAQAKRLGFDAEDRFRRNRRMAEELFIRDRLYRDSVRSRVDVTRDEIHRRFVEEQQQIQFDFLFNTSEPDMRNLHRLLQSGIPFDTLLTEQQRAAGDDSSNLRESEIDEVFRARIDSLRPGAVSRPLQGKDGWYIVRKMDYGNPFRNEYELQKRSKRIENQLRARKEVSETVAFVRRLWNGREARFSDAFYRELGQALLNNYRAQAMADTSDMLLADSSVFDSLRRAWEPELDQAFVRIVSKNAEAAGNEVSVLPDSPKRDSGDKDDFSLGIGAALDRLEASDLRLEKIDLKSFPQLYRVRTQELADRFLMTQEAYRLRLDQHPDVRRDIAMWSASGLAQMIPELLWEQFIASDDSVWNYYVSRPDIFGPPVEVKLVEVLNRDEEEILKVVDAFRAGESLHAAAVRSSDRPGAAERNGELGFFPVSHNGIIGRAAFGLRIADAAGPLKTPEGFSFFQLIDKRYPGREIRNWDELRDTVAAAAREGLMRERTDTMLRKLAGEGGIRVELQLLEKVPVTSMQMFTVRALGFGGRIPAVPGVMPLYDAVMEGMEGTVAP